jgi:hypothetical protein
LEEDLNFFENGIPQVILKMEDDLNCFVMEDSLKKKIMQPKTFKIKTMVVVPLRVT